LFSVHVEFIVNLLLHFRYSDSFFQDLVRNQNMIVNNQAFAIL